MKVEPVYEAVGERIRARRLRLNWTQGDLAEDVGVSRAGIANIELGKSRVSLHVLADIADCMGLSPRYLFPTKPEIRARLKEKIRELKAEIGNV